MSKPTCETRRNPTCGDPTTAWDIYGFKLPTPDVVELTGDEAILQWNLAVKLANARTQEVL